jgi:hypothetical protein
VAKRLHIGSTLYDASNLDGQGSEAITTSTNHPTFHYFLRGWPNAVYIGVMVVAGELGDEVGNTPCECVELFRLPVPSNDYRPHLPEARHLAIWFSSQSQVSEDEKARFVYAIGLCGIPVR